jgi:hypothetical protein
MTAILVPGLDKCLASGAWGELSAIESRSAQSCGSSTARELGSVASDPRGLVASWAGPAIVELGEPSPTDGNAWAGGGGGMEGAVGADDLSDSGALGVGSGTATGDKHLGHQLASAGTAAPQLSHGWVRLTWIASSHLSRVHAHPLAPLSAARHSVSNSGRGAAEDYQHACGHVAIPVADEVQ